MIYGKKEIPVLIYKILSEYTDENHYLKQAEIIEKLSILYDIDVDRKTVSNTITLLQNLDYDIVKNPKGGYALFSRLLDENEIKYINDAIFSSKVIPGKQAKELSIKLSSILSKYQRKKYTYLHKSTEINRTDNDQLFYNIELIQEAIDNNKKVSFEYLTYNEKGETISRYNGYRFNISPYYLVNNFGKYYVLGHYRDKYDPIQVYRLDYLLDLRIEEKERKSMSEVEGLEKFDIVKYINEHVYLFSSKVIEAKVQIDEMFAIQYVYDYFGKSVKIYNKDGKLYFSVTSNIDALYYWLLQYGEYFTLIEPTELIERIKEHNKKTINKYN